MSKKNRTRRNASRTRSMKQQRRMLVESLESRTMLAADAFAPLIEADLVGEGEARGEGESRALDNLEDYAKALEDSGTTFFGSFSCPVCARQKSLFGDAADFLPYVEVTNPDGSLNQTGIDNNITTFPTWDFPDGSRQTGFLSLSELSEASGVPLPTNIVVLETNVGDVEIETLGDDAPVTVNNFLNYANDGDYDNSIFHRLVAGFVIQGGGFATPSETLTSVNQISSVPTDPPIVNEFGVSNTRGTVAMAKLGGNPNSATSQFFFNLGNNSGNLDNQNGGFTVFGVVRDMAVVDQMAQTPTGNFGGVFASLPVSATNQLVVVRDVVGSGEVFGTAFEDANLDGIRQLGEAPVEGMTAFIDANDNGIFDAGELSATTEADGTYSIVAESGDHVVRFLPAADEFATTGATGRHEVSLDIGRTTTLDLGRYTVGNVAAIDLAAGSDTGASDTDNLTNLDNSVPANALEFVVTGPGDGALVKLFNGNQLLGEATASGGSATIMTDGDFELDGSTVITARQEVGSIVGPSDTSLTINVDDTAPIFTSTPPTASKVADPISYDANTQDNNETFALVNGPTGASIDSGTGIFSWTPTAVQVGDHDFQISATDDAGNQTLQQLNLQILSNEQLVIRLDVTDLAGNSISEINVGEQFLVKGFAKDNRVNAQGVADAYFDLLYQNNLVLPDGAITFGANFPDSQTGDASQIGVIDELGASGNTTVVNGGELLLFEIPFLANVEGTETFTGEGADDFPASESFLIGDVNPSPPDVIKIESDTLMINASFGANGDIASVDEDSVDVDLNVLANDQQFQGSTAELTISAVGAASNGGTAQIAGDMKSVLYTPAADFVGVDTFTYTITDGVDTDTATVVVNVLDVNDVPMAVNDSFDLNEDDPETLLDVVLNDSTDPDVGETLLIVGVGDPNRNGEAKIGGAGSFVLYTPAPNTFGVETFTYTLRDSRGLTQEATVTVNLAAVNDDPTAVNDVFNLNEDDPAAIFRPLVNDTIAPDENETLTISEVTDPASGTVAIVDNASGIEFTPAPDFVGIVSVNYSISDGNGGASTNTIVFNVADVNDPPTAADDTQSVTRDSGPHFIDVLPNDSIAPDTDETLSVTAVTGAANGVATVSADGTGIDYTPNPDFTGEEVLTYTASDNRGGTATAQVTITVLDFEPSMLGGAVFVDSNGNGIRDFGEQPIGGVNIELRGVDDFGANVALNAITDSEGNYEFNELAPGNYSLMQEQMMQLIDGAEHVGTQGGSADTNDVITIDLEQGTEGLANNFTERGRSVEFVKLSDFFLRPPMPQAEVFEDTNSGQQSFALGLGWEEVTGVQVANPDNGQGAALLQITTGNGISQTVAVPNNQIETRVSGDQVYRRILASVADLGVQTNGAQAQGEGERNLLAATPVESVTPPMLIQPIIETQPVEVPNSAAPSGEGESGLRLNAVSPAIGQQFETDSALRRGTSASVLAKQKPLTADLLMADWPSESVNQDVDQALVDSDSDYAETLDELLSDDSDLLLD